ncbi:hypothetical protein Anas_13557, partial [Armadillidium nasatum]
MCWKIQVQLICLPKQVLKCGHERKASQRTDRFLLQLALKNRTSCRRLLIELAVQGASLARRSVNDRLLENELKAYHLRKKPRLTETMKDILPGLGIMLWPSQQWEKKMPKNIEIKAHVSVIADVHSLAQELSGSEGTIIEQTDTFFQVPKGRLKLREITVNEPVEDIESSFKCSVDL